MWPAKPQAAATHEPFRNHDEPASMGDAQYLRAGRPGSVGSSAGGHSADSQTGLVGAGAPVARRSSQSTNGTTGNGAGRAGTVGAGAYDDGLDDSFKGGMPIGLLAALGTPYAKKPIYKSKKFLILCPILTIGALAIGIVLLVFPILRAVALHTLSTSVLHIDASNITSPTNSTFTLTLQGQVKKVGIFPAHLYFHRPVRAYWVSPKNTSREIQIGHFNLDYIGVAAGHGRIKQQTKFFIDDEPGFTEFAQYLITQDQFTWRLKSTEVQAKAFGFIPANHLDFTKDLTLPAMANFTNVEIKDFQLPGDDPAGGISLSVVTSLTNPSSFGIEIGVLSVSLFYGDLLLGPAHTSGPVNLTAGVNYVHLVGRLLPYENDNAALQKLGTLFSAYLNGDTIPVQARGLSIDLPGGQNIAWLTAGISALTLNVPLKSPTGRIAPITGITIQELSLQFDPSQPYAPQANSSAVSATFGLPFGFSLNIVRLQNDFGIVDNRTIVASLSTPYGSSNTTITSRNAGYTLGDISLDLPKAPLTIGPTYDDHLAFDQFTYDLTTTNGSRFLLVGNTSAVTDTPLGQVALTDIGFTVPAGLIGLESLKTYPTIIESVDVLGGTPDAILLNISVGLTNPSNLDLQVGNVTFQLFNGDSFLGTTVLPDLHLTTGFQTRPSVGYFQANNNQGSLDTLTAFVTGNDTQLQISGFNGSTATESLTQAFMALHLNATLPGLKTKLLNYANLTVLPTTGVTNDFADSTVSLANPFTAPLNIKNIQSNITSFGLFVGSIVTDTNFASAGHSNTDSPTLPFNLNLYPPDIFSLLRALAVEQGMATDQIDGIVKLGGYQYVPTAPSPTASRRVKRAQEHGAYGYVDGLDGSPEGLAPIGNETGDALVFSQESKRGLEKRNIYTGFDLPSYVLKAFSGLKVNVDLLTTLNIGEYTTSLKYSQPGVAAYTDSSLTLLLPVLARPIVQKIVDEASLGVDTVMITNPTTPSFQAGLVGSIRNSGPFDAVIAFAEGLTVAWNGQPLGQIAMPNVSLVADVGADLNLEAAFNVADVGHLTDFTGYLLTEPSFTWQIYGQNLEVSALGITVSGISIMKDVVLTGMNGFKNLVTIESFDLPYNDPAGGIHLTLQTQLTNPSSVGVALAGIGFQNFFGNTNIGPAASNGSFALKPKATIQLPLVGRLIPQSDPKALNDVSTIFNGFVHGVPSELVVHGDSAGNTASWLETGIKKLAIPVILPAAQNLQVINGININSLTLQFSQSDPWNPAFTTTDTIASFGLPFAFPVDITSLASKIYSADTGSGKRAKRANGDFALLNIPSNPAKTDVTARTIVLAFANVPFASVDNNLFASFLTQVTDDVSKTFQLHGAADTVAGTAVGPLNLDGIAFSVSTSLLGLQGLNARPATVSELDVYHGFSNYLQINVNAHLYNPSNITIGTGNVAFGLNFQNQQIGTANINNLVLAPGVNVVPTAVHYEPHGGAAQAAGQLLLENYIQDVNSSTIIQGTDSTTPIDSLKPALKTIQLGTIIPAYTQNLITQAALTFPIDIATTDEASTKVTLQNPFTAQVNLLQVLANATYGDNYLGQVNTKPNPVFSTAGHSTATSQNLPFTLNADPKALIRFLEAVAAANGVDLGILIPEFNYVLGLASTASSVTTTVNTQPETCAPTGTTKLVQGLILAAVKNLKTNLTIQSTVKLDDFQTPLNFNQFNVPTVLDDSVLYLTGILGKTIVSHIVDGTALTFKTGQVTDLTNSGFKVALTGSLLNAGPFDALIEFPQGVQVIYKGNHIADLALPPICSSGGSGVPNLQTTATLTITDKGRFTGFATDLLLNPDFTWTITTNKLRVYALQTIFDNVSLTKDVSFKAFDGLPGVTITRPDFPSDSPHGIALKTETAIPSLSNLGVQLGTATFIANFQGIEVGPISANDLTLAPLATTDAVLTGEVLRQTSSKGLNMLGVLFSQFLQGVNQTLDVTGQEVVSPAQPNSPVDWLSAAFKKLTIHVTLPGGHYDIIHSVTLQDLTIQITEQSEAYAVPTSNNRTVAIYQNPFGFSLTAIAAGGDFYINYNGVDTALLPLPVAKSVSAETSTGNNATLVLDFKKQILTSLNTGSFNNFFNAVTNTAEVSFNLHGGANVTAQTNAGNIPISGIPFSVGTSLAGIQSLNARPTVVSNLDVHHGYPTYLQILADATLFNPSQITVITNDVNFGLDFMNQIIGTVVIGDLLLIPDTNVLGTEVRYAPTGGASTAAGMVLLANYIQGITSNVAIAGTPNTTPYGSLQEALGSIKIQTSIPPIHQLLVTKASLSFPIDIADTGIAEASFDLSNPFTASINLQALVANATYDTFYLGQINQQPLKPEISAPGHKNITSRKVPFELTDDPKFLINFLIAVAKANGVDLGILLPEFQYVLSEASTATSVTSQVNTGKETCTPTGTTKEVQNIILAAVKNLKTDLGIQSTVALDEFVTPLNFAQNGVPTVLDDSVLYLTGLLGRTIVSHIVDQAELTFSGGNVTDITDNGFKVALTGSLLNAGPFDALIQFPDGVDVLFQGNKIANIELPPICSAGSSGVPDYKTTGTLRITDQGGFTSFASYLLNNPSFTWVITSNTVQVYALQTIFSNVTLTKNVTFQALNKLPGVKLTNPDFPGDASNGIELTVDSTIPSMSNLGFELGTVNFISSYHGSEIGPVHGNGLTLAPMATTPLPLEGTIIYRNDPAGVAALGEVFSQFLAGKEVPLDVTGDSVVTPAQPGSPVSWLSAAFKTLTINVTLPGKQFDIISAISIKDLIVTVTQPSEAYAALIQSNETDVTYKNPYKFSLQAIQAGGDFIINYGGSDAGQLEVPVQDVVSSQTSTGNPADLVLAIREPGPLVAIDEGTYNNFFAAITLQSNVGFTLHGGANVTARTKAGDIPITGIPFSNIQTSFPGINGFGGKATIPQTPVVIGGGSGDPFNPSPGGEFLRITLSTILDNPAPLVLHTNDASFEVIYKGTQVGRAYINPLDLYKGTNTLATEFHYQPADPADATAEDLLTQYLETKGQIPLTIQGDGTSSPYGSLQEAFTGVHLETSFPGQGIPLVHDIQIFVDFVTAFCNDTATFDFRIDNNLKTYITILTLSGTASQNGVVYATFDYTFMNPTETNAGENPGPYTEQVLAKLPQGAAGSLPLLVNSAQGVDIDITSKVSIGGYVAPSFKYSQKAVPYTVVITAGGSTVQGGLLGALTGLLGELGSLFSCIGGVLSPKGPIPGLLSTLLHITAPISSIVSGVLSDVSGVVSGVTSVVGGVTSQVGSVVSGVTSLAGSVIGDVTSVLPTPAASVVGAATSVAGAAAGAATSVVGGAASKATAAIGSIAGGLGLRERDQLALEDVFAQPTPTAAVYPVHTGADDLSPTSTIDAEASGPTITPTPIVQTYTPLRPEDSLAIAAYQGGVDPAVFSRVLKKYGFEMGEDVQMYRQKREEREREARLEKRDEEEKRAEKKKRWGSRTH
ncbi:pre-rRNA processing protein [Rhodotorula toruloides]|uniref:Pre-rRNA processing protein n=1 Tax=Rhodotorula toruloides TaxID=5286 RepID=A0A511KG65_RHOTO|nr:pre-rRNA processing protein [Rhodotorula toruloides]